MLLVFPSCCKVLLIHLTLYILLHPFAHLHHLAVDRRQFRGLVWRNPRVFGPYIRELQHVPRKPNVHRLDSCCCCCSLERCDGYANHFARASREMESWENHQMCHFMDKV